MSTIPFLFCTITCFLTVTASARIHFHLDNDINESTPPVALPMAPPPARGPSSDCSTIIYDMVDCIGYLSDGDELKPSEACCSGIKSVLKVDKECLCEAIKMSGDMGIALNLAKAKSLPADCGVKHFSSSICDSGSSESPVAAPVAAPVTAPVSSPKVSPAPAPTLAPPKASSAPEASPAAGRAGEKGAPPPSALANGGANAISSSVSLVIGMLIVSSSYLIAM